MSTTFVSSNVVSLPSKPLAATKVASGFSFAALKRFGILAEIVAVLVVSFTLSRLGYLLWFADWKQLSLADVLKVFVTGLRFDLLVALLSVQFQLWHFTFCRNQRLLTRGSRWFMEGCWSVIFVFVPLLVIIEALFFSEFDGRLNYIAFEYLVYPTEVCCNIWQSFPVVELLLVVAVFGLGPFFFFRKRFVRRLEDQMPLSNRLAVFGGTWALIAGLWATSGMASMNVTQDRTSNECAGNGLYTFVYHAWTCHFDYEQYYLTINRSEAAQEVRKHLVRPGDDAHEDSANPLDRTVHQAAPRKDWNVVIILEESFGSDFVGVLGDNRGLTPCFDKLSREATLFDNFYATGNRTARALEAVTTSLPPIPTESILKRDHSQHVFTLAHALKERDYNRTFMYAGRGVFDGVRSFMTANGFDRFVEQKDFVNPEFVNAWGVSDEDLFNRALTEFDGLHAEGKPFFAMLLTVSNHRPFTYPDGRIDRPSSELSRENAVKYADWSIGMFFDKAKDHAWKKDTIFVVMGDHGARVYGSQKFPMKSYRVPVLLMRPDEGGEEKRCNTLASSLDIAPTIMGLLGGDYRSVFFGRDVLSLPPEQGYALMQHNHDVALLTADDKLVVLDARRQAWVYDFDKTNFSLKAEKLPSPERLRSAVSFFQTANRLYYDEHQFPGLPIKPSLSPLGASDIAGQSKDKL